MRSIDELLHTPHDFASESYQKIVSILQEGIYHPSTLKVKLLQSPGGFITPIGMRELLCRLIVFFNGDVVEITFNEKIEVVTLTEYLPDYTSIRLIEKGPIRLQMEERNGLFNSHNYKKESEEEIINHFSQFLMSEQSSVICQIFNVEKTESVQEFLEKAQITVKDVWEVSFYWKMPELIFSSKNTAEQVLKEMDREQAYFKIKTEDFIFSLLQIKVY